jgi:exosortase K
MKINQNTPYYIVVILLFLGLRYVYTQATTDNVLLLLAPTSKIVSLLLGSPAEYDSTNGYFFANLGIVINKSCSGFTFWLVAFTMLIFVRLQHCESHFSKILLFIKGAIIVYLLTVLANASRILFAIKINQLLPDLHQEYYWLHETQGNAIYLAVLIGFYLLVTRSSSRAGS